ncbi:MAG: hypothetical protein ACO3NZ_04450 [Pirellulales bacterium]|jgi:hypothetical protein
MIRLLAAAITVLVVAAAGLVTVGLAFGNAALLLPKLPPSSGMDRFLLLVWPVACLVEVGFAGARRRWPSAKASSVRVLLRIAAAWLLGGGLLWGSVHLRGQVDWVLLGLWCMGAASVWEVLPRHDAQRSVATSLAIALVATGTLMVVGGWLKGGLTSLPLALSVGLLGWRLPDAWQRGVVVGCGAAAAVGLLSLGHFFGRVSVLQGAVVALSLVTVTLLLASRSRAASDEVAQL